jgi:hypothetical protein
VLRREALRKHRDVFRWAPTSASGTSITAHAAGSAARSITLERNARIEPVGTVAPSTHSWCDDAAARRRRLAVRIRRPSSVHSDLPPGRRRVTGAVAPRASRETLGTHKTQPKPVGDDVTAGRHPLVLAGGLAGRALRFPRPLGARRLGRFGHPAQARSRHCLLHIRSLACSSERCRPSRSGNSTSRGIGEFEKVCRVFSRSRRMDLFLHPWRLISTWLPSMRVSQEDVRLLAKFRPFRSR